MKSDNNKYLFFIFLGLYLTLNGMNSFHLISFGNNSYSFGYTFGYNLGRIFRVLLGMALLTKGIFFYKENRIR